MAQKHLKWSLFSLLLRFLLWDIHAIGQQLNCDLKSAFHCVNSICIRCYSVRMRENTNQNISKYRHFSRSVYQYNFFRNWNDWSMRIIFDWSFRTDLLRACLNLQWNLLITDILYERHLSITDTFLSNG